LIYPICPGKSTVDFSENHPTTTSSSCEETINGLANKQAKVTCLGVVSMATLTQLRCGKGNQQAAAATSGSHIDPHIKDHELLEVETALSPSRGDTSQRAG